MYRNAFFYVLNRADGKFLLGKPFARQTWAKGLDNNGRPIPSPNSESGGPKSFLYPGLLGATNWQAPSYDPVIGWLYVTFLEKGVRYTKQATEYEPGKEYWGGRYTEEGREWGGLKAIDPETGKIEWEYKFSPGTHYAGVLATGGGVVFSASYDGNLMAFDSRAGRLLWHFYTGANIASSPMSYAVDGNQYVAISAGGVLYSFALPNSE
jgi:alcohol dehydrogenase (cytochrome c)